jgi:arylsulfatase A-like enzyme
VTYEDVFPTLLDLAGLDIGAHLARIDGRSLKPFFNDVANRHRGYPRDTFYWHYPFNVKVSHPDDGLPPAPHSTIRQGDFKLIYDWSGRLYLYDLKNDWREQHNLVGEKPDLTKSLFTELNRWLDAEVAAKYLPALNPTYDPAKEMRAYPFVDLRAKLIGSGHAIRNAGSDPRLQELIR